MNKKVVAGDYTDPETGLRFVEDVLGNLHCLHTVVEGHNEITVVVDMQNSYENESKRYKRILEKLRMENNWLWYVLEKAISEGKKNPKQALANLEKAVKERTR